MACMNSRTAAFSEAAEHLSNGETLVIQDLQWDDYESGTGGSSRPPSTD